MSSTREIWPGNRFEILFDRASRLTEPARGALLDQIREEDPDMADELLSLLEAGDAAGGLDDVRRRPR